MNFKNENSEPKELGVCPVCTRKVFDNELFVQDEEVYHFSCYNETKKDDKVVD